MNARGERRPASAAREAALQMQYAVEMSGQSPSEVEGWHAASQPLTPAVRAAAAALVAEAATQRERIEALISRHAVGWRLERITAIDRSILKLAVAELLRGGSSAAAVVEAALGLARKYSQPDAVRFVHAILDAIAGELAGAAEAAPRARPPASA